MSKLNPRLFYKLMAYRRGLAADRGESPPLHAELAPDGDERIKIGVEFTGAIEVLKHAGFAPRSVQGQISFGTIRLADLERLIALPEVVRVEGEEEPDHPQLEISVP